MNFFQFTFPNFFNLAELNQISDPARRPEAALGHGGGKRYGDPIIHRCPLPILVIASAAHRGEHCQAAGLAASRRPD
jgi:hypothetical protein